MGLWWVRVGEVSTYKAMVLPRLISERRIVKTQVIKTELSGIMSFGWT